ncbi:MAG: hypothetical protein ACLTBV_22105 [Enterocloster bolteae]
MIVDDEAERPEDIDERQSQGRRWSAHKKAAAPAAEPRGEFGDVPWRPWQGRLPGLREAICNGTLSDRKKRA